MKRCILQTKFYLLSVILSLASCTQDELTGKSQGDPLPPGKYPITFTAVQAAPEGMPQTRVSDYEEDGTHKSNWTAGDKIEVTVGKDGNTISTTCELDEYGNIQVYTPQLYWQTTDNYTINAWYSNLAGQSTGTGSTVSLADQSDRLAYVLKARPINASYQTTSMKLEFEQQLAKVRVTVVNDGYTGNLENLSVVMQECYTSCTVTDGSVGNGGSKGEIKMCNVENYTFEANVLDGTVLKDNAFKISADGKTSVVSLSNGVTLAKGKVHTVTLKVKDGSATEVAIDEGGTTKIEGAGNYLIKGSHSGSIVEIMKDGSYIIILEGTQLNKIELNHLATANITYIIKGNVTLDEGILAAGKGKISIKGTEGSILTINKSDPWQMLPAIGNATGWNTGVELIIEDAHIVAAGGLGAAVIGTNSGDIGRGSVGDITIRNSTLELTAQSYAPDAPNGIKPAVIGTGGHPNSDGEGVHCGDIKIYLKEGETKQEFLDRLGGVFHTKVGAGLDKSGKDLTSCGSINWYNSQGDPVD